MAIPHSAQCCIFSLFDLRFALRYLVQRRMVLVPRADNTPAMAPSNRKNGSSFAEKPPPCPESDSALFMSNSTMLLSLMYVLKCPPE